MRKTVLILAALAAFICCAEPDDAATEAYAHFEATNEVAKAKAQIDASISTKSAQDRAYASSVASNALATAKSYADGLVVDVDSDGITSNAVETAIMIIDGRGYLLPSSTNGLAKASYVDAKVMEQIDLWKAELGTTNYAPKSWVLSLDYTTLGAVQSYLASMDYASKGHVSDNYVSKEQLNAADYAQKTWVDSYVAEHMPEGGGGLTTEDVDAEIRKHSLGGIWDAGLEVWWTPVMTNGCLIYKATTNVNMNAEVTP